MFDCNALTNFAFLSFMKLCHSIRVGGGGLPSLAPYGALQFSRGHAADVGDAPTVGRHAAEVGDATIVGHDRRGSRVIAQRLGEWLV